MNNRFSQAPSIEVQDKETGQKIAEPVTIADCIQVVHDGMPHNTGHWSGKRQAEVHTSSVEATEMMNDCIHVNHDVVADNVGDKGDV
ncbi:hypothetical protein JMJ78_0000886 [Colletotrichum scovillei]|nr:hypothetical protein JMJ78_0000886 [Colletotrichum scovillei]